MRTLALLGNDGHRALVQALTNSEWRTVEQALASLTVFASPITIEQMNNRPIFRIIRGSIQQIAVAAGDDSSKPDGYDRLKWAPLSIR
jgi:hypothetical protein